QSDKEKCGEAEDAVDHLALGNEVHEKAGNEKGLPASDEQSHGNIPGVASKGNIRGADRDDGPKDQGVKNVKITPDVMAKMVGMFGCMRVAHRSNTIRVNIERGTEKSTRDQRSARR